jgi:catechol 2,3-dioxygenase-like lactoylglutathione lyase family enzyme
VDVLSSRVLLRPSDLDRSRRFYRDLLGLATCREFGPPDDPGAGVLPWPGGRSRSPGTRPAGRFVLIWIQVRDVHAGQVRLAAAGVPIVREPAAEPWGLTEMWIEDPTASGSSWSRFLPITLSPRPAAGVTAMTAIAPHPATEGAAQP